VEAAGGAVAEDGGELQQAIAGRSGGDHLIAQARRSGATSTERR
jgi:hypothetical protein